MYSNSTSFPQGVCGTLANAVNTWIDFDEALRACCEATPIVYPVCGGGGSGNHLDKPEYRIPEVERIIYNNPATIVFWSDDTKTVVKAMSTTEFNPYHGFCAAVAKKMFGGNCAIKRMIRDKGGIDVNADPNVVEGEFIE